MASKHKRSKCDTDNKRETLTPFHSNFKDPVNRFNSKNVERPSKLPSPRQIKFNIQSHARNLSKTRNSTCRDPS